ncbi:9201_t:CDS:2 [Ambispora leptoticha]|uniref:9201_t:CDS:1 n=1 Tax=Ambispora leptoticha TaxID=144679 RepID=A0A9N8YW09_9GLOM|nr:9201_t:CDS:2 [Ambispora leptoticha]
MDDYFIGVDVGTASVRAAVVDSKGIICGLSSNEIRMWTSRTGYYEQSSDNIWQSVCLSVKQATEKANVFGPRIKGIGFDATCSLVVLDLTGNPLSVSPDENFQENERNIILWADHRAAKQAEKINATKHHILNYVGGKVGVEMETPKILWLKENMPDERWEEIGHFFDLPDFLTYRATGSFARSVCSLTCKCGFVPPDPNNNDRSSEKESNFGWYDDFFEAIGLGEFVKDKYSRLGGIPGVSGRIWSAGQLVGGLSKQAAKELGLDEGTSVGSAVIDAYAGAIGTLAAPLPILKTAQLTKSKAKNKDEDNEISSISAKFEDLPEKLAVISGTSSCHLVLSPKPIFVNGIWGPYRDVIIPNYWMSEGGQSATGQLIDWIVNSHPFSNEAKALAESHNLSIYSFLNNHIIAMQTREGVEFPGLLIKDLHVYPDFHGNRSPIADPKLRGTITGLSIDISIDSFALVYYSAILSIGFGTREIIESLNNAGHKISTLLLSGGLCKNSLFVKTIADATQCQVLLPKYIEASVVLGAAMCGARAYGVLLPKKESDGADNAAAAKIKKTSASITHSDKNNNLEMWNVMVKMSQPGSIVRPTNNEKEIKFNEKKYNIYKLMRQDQINYRDIMENAIK